jgi:hypothetical protein
VLPEYIMQKVIELSRCGAIYDAFGLIRTTFKELDWKKLIFFERAVQISPNAW